MKTNTAAAAEKTAEAEKPTAKPSKARASKAKASTKAANDSEVKKQAVAKPAMVGQKPRSGKSEAVLRPTSLPAQPVDEPAVISTMTKSSPEAKAAKQSFKVNDKIVYPAHGVGTIVGVEKQMIAGIANELFVIDFDHEKMKLRVPTAKAVSVGMRPLADDPTVKKAIEVLKGRARVKRTMWSRRAQEYEAKINSGDIIQVSEVVRDLFRSSDQPEQSYSERQLFEAALDRLGREVAAVRGAPLESALNELSEALSQKKAA
ncbi:MAG: CarD family transcriptional regulator [Pseudomonadota bacterium]